MSGGAPPRPGWGTAGLGLPGSLVGFPSPPPHPTSNTGSFPAISKHLDKPNPFQPNQYVLRQASAHSGTPPPQNQPFLWGMTFSGEGNKIWVVETFFSFLGFFFLQTNFAFFGLFFLPLTLPFSAFSPPLPIHHLPSTPIFPHKIVLFSLFCVPGLRSAHKKNVTRRRSIRQTQVDLKIPLLHVVADERKFSALPLTKCPHSPQGPSVVFPTKNEKEKKRKICNNWKKEL